MLSRTPVFPNCTPREEIAASLRLLFRPGDVFEIRVAGVGGRDQTDVGYFDDADLAATSVVTRYDGRVEAVWTLLNAIPQDMLARSPNAFYTASRRKGATTDDHIVRRRWLLVDCDAAYPHKLGISASAAEHEQTMVVGERIVDALLDGGWQSP